MTVKRTGLGRGLEALLSQRPASIPSSVPSSESAAPALKAAAGDELAKIPLDLLQRGRYQPRVDMRPETLEELAQSIKV